MIKRILVPVDGSPQSVKALRFAAEEWPDAELTLFHAIDPMEAGYMVATLPSGSEEWYRSAKSDAEELFAEVGGEVDARLDSTTEVGRPTRAIVEVAEEGPYDHIVMGSHGRQGVSRILLGSVAEFVVRKSPVPVTIIR